MVWLLAPCISSESSCRNIYWLHLRSSNAPSSLSLSCFCLEGLSPRFTVLWCQHPSGLNLNITSKTKSAAKPQIKLRLFWLSSEFVEWQMGETRDFCSCLEVTVQHCHRGLALCLEEIWFIICRDSILSDISSSKYSQLLRSSTANQGWSTVSGLSKGCLS